MLRTPASVALAIAPAPAASPVGAASRLPGTSEIAGASDVHGFDAVYDACFEFAWRTARRLGVDESSVEDVVQEVFFVVHRKLPEFEGRSALRTWVYSIVLHVVRHHRRSLRRKDGPLAPLTEAHLADLPDGRSAGLLAAAETRDDVRRLDQLLRALDDEKREVFVLAHLEEMTAPEIADILGENVNTVYSRLRAAKEQFEAALDRQRARDAPGNPTRERDPTRGRNPTGGRKP
jgi:RNA polymerase sigma-70 factor, ECF subfamily